MTDKTKEKNLQQRFEELNLNKSDDSFLEEISKYTYKPVNKENDEPYIALDNDSKHKINQDDICPIGTRYLMR